MSFFSLLFLVCFVGSEKCRLVLLNISCCKIKLTEVQLFHLHGLLEINTPLSSCLHMSNSTSYLSGASDLVDLVVCKLSA